MSKCHIVGNYMSWLNLDEFQTSLDEVEGVTVRLIFH